MSDKLRPLPFRELLSWIAIEFGRRGEIFGIPQELFHRPRPDAPYVVEDFLGARLGTPIGPAAGPHTQLAQNIVSAWLTGGRFIELKTVQIMDELEIPRPCIDMEDEGYNVEWSQELRLAQSADEYIKAWVLVHVLPRLLGWGDVPFDTIFNMSVGYDLKGITSPPMLEFMDRLEDASDRIAELMEIVAASYPELAEVEVPSRVTNSVTLSTMHGCPPDEIEGIVEFLLTERKLHTFVKLNPTLLGKDEVIRILHDDLGFREIEVPDSAFEHDLAYERAVALIRRLKDVAQRQGLIFGVKLSNTLAVRNHKGTLPGEEMYLSGRALYPITMNLFLKLEREFDGELLVSYAGGADALNVADILASGALPVTAASDLLKPGGYARFGQYLETIERAMREAGAKDLASFSARALDNLARAAAEARRSPRYRRSARAPLPKVSSALEPFDCITAPCIEQCPVRQDIPDYIWWIAKGDPDRALEAILAKNPLPGVTGYVCTHLCETRCTRANYDEPLAIRELKRFAFEHGTPPSPTKWPPVGKRVAIVGAGPAGLTAAYFLALSGVAVTVFEARDRPGGMLQMVPVFRLPDEVIRKDVERILALGIDLRLSTPVERPPEELLAEGFDAVFLAAGAQREVQLAIPGIEGAGVWPSLALLEAVRRGERPELGERVLVIGGGDTAMDAARTAKRLSRGRVTVLYRRSRAEMPASPEELAGALEEGIELLELVSPVRVIREGDRLVGLECVRNELGEPGPDGRRRPVPIEGSEFVIPADSVIVAIGQQPDLSFLSGTKLELDRDSWVKVDPRTGRVTAGVYAGGDLVPGPHSVIAACGDGLKAARAICRELGIPFHEPQVPRPRPTPEEIVEIKRRRARRELRTRPAFLPPERRRGFELVESGFTWEEASREASRCLQCSLICDKCVEVCPNRANLTFIAEPVDWEVPVVALEGGALKVVAREAFRVSQGRQILHLHDFCNECGNCSTFCVHQGRPYVDKPRLFLNRDEFEGESGNAYFISGRTIYRREGGRELSLTLVEDGYRFEDDLVELELSPELEIRGWRVKQAFSGQLSLRPAAEMAVILRGARSSLPYLPVWDESG